VLPVAANGCDWPSAWPPSITARVTVPWLVALIVTVGAAAGLETPPLLSPPPPQPARPTGPINAAIRNLFKTLSSVEMTHANVAGCHGSLTPAQAKKHDCCEVLPGHVSLNSRPQAGCARAGVGYACYQAAGSHGSPNGTQVRLAIPHERRTRQERRGRRGGNLRGGAAAEHALRSGQER